MKKIFIVCAVIFSISVVSVGEAVSSSDLFNRKTQRKNVDQKRITGNDSGKEDVLGDTNRGDSRGSQADLKDKTKDRLSKLHPIVIMHLKELAQLCLSGWDDKSCLAAVSSASMSLTSRYAETLHNAGEYPYMDRLRDSCAASTAATKIDVPAYAIKDALTKCANEISDITEETGAKPDVSHYQLIIGSILCLGDDKACLTFESQLRSFKE